MKNLVWSAAFGCFVLVAQAIDFTVQNGETLDLSDAKNAAVDFKTNSVILKAGATLKLKTAMLSAFLKVDGGEATMVAPEESGAVALEGGLRELNGGKLKVENATSLTFGRTLTSYANWPMIDAEDISGVDEILLDKRIFVRKVPETGFRVAQGAWLGFDESNVLKRVSGTADLTAFTLENWNLLMLTDEVFPVNTMVTVKGGSAFAFKPCAVDVSNGWAGFPASDNKVNQNDDKRRAPFASITNVVLASEGDMRAKVMSVSVREFDFMGDITGDGDFEMNAGCLYNERTNLRGNLTFTGTVTLAGNADGVIVYSASFGDPANRIFLNNNGNRLQIRGRKPVATNEVTVAELTGISQGQVMYLMEAATWKIGRLSGAVCFAGQGLSYTARVERLSANATPYLTGQAAFCLLSAEAGSKIMTRDYGEFTELLLDLREYTGDVIPPIDVVERLHLTVLGGQGKMLTVTGKGSITAPDCAGIVQDRAEFAVDVMEGATQTVGIAETAAAGYTNWTAKVAQWYDASVSGTLFGYPKNTDGTAVCYTNGYPIIARWTDCRYDAVAGTNRVHLYNGRSFKNEAGGFSFGDRHDEVNPYVVKGGLNGLDYVSMGSYEKMINAKYRKPTDTGTVTEARRILMVKAGDKGNVANPTEKQDCACAILVYGSAQGGGAAVLGGIGGSRDTTVDKPFFKSGSWPMYVDGVETNGATACPNGGWQILTLAFGENSKKPVNAFGWYSTYSTSGGQDYAEIILFETMPTDAERRACELYLAKKWGLLPSYRGDRTPVAPKITANGKGRIVLESDAAVDGGFRGTVEVEANRTLVITDAAIPPGVEAVPSQDRVMWFDPDYEGALCLNNASDEDKRVRYMRSRTDEGLNADKTKVMSGLTGGSDRRPWADTSAHGDGPVRTWLDFGNHLDVNGNTLRYQTNYNDGTSYSPIGNIREGFMVLDTSRGGGSPIGNEVNFASTRRNGEKTPNVTHPIWSANWGVFTNVTTRLDDLVVDGKSNGFHGRPEVLEFSFVADWDPAFFGYYKPGDGTSAGNTEILGESVFYSKPLSAQDRNRVTAYLAYKWFGKVLKGYNDLSHSCVAGAGRVEVNSLAMLPSLADDFTGTVATFQSELAFTIDSAANPSAATDAWTGCALELALYAKIKVMAVSDLADGDYALIADCILPDGVLPELVVEANAFTEPFLKNGKCRLKLAYANGALLLHVPPRGLTVLIR